jgi:O-antigen/teichoic acid export membrane protein
MKYLGGEAYGLVGLFTVVQSWLQLLNMGLAPTLGREAAKATASESGFSVFYRVLVSYELIFLAIVFCIVVSGIYASSWISASWLSVESLTFAIVETSVVLIVLSAAVRFQGNLYRSGLMGLERQVFVNGLDIVFVSLRFLGGLFLVASLDFDILQFLMYQACLALAEVLTLRYRLFYCVPKMYKSAYGFSWVDIRPTLPFALGVAYTAGVWVLVTQVDKFLMSNLLTLTEFGYYTLIALVVGGILQIQSPIAEAIKPRMTALAAKGEKLEFYQLYITGTKFVASICFSTAVVIAFNAKEIIFLWTGSKEAAIWSEDILYWFALGNGILAVGAFQYYLQFAFGRLRLHVIGTSLTALIQVPAIIFAAYMFGALGAAQVWFGVRLALFLFWVPIVHRAFAEGLHTRWLTNGVLAMLFFPLVIAIVWPRSYEILESHRMAIAFSVISEFSFSLVLSLLMITSLRRRIYSLIMACSRRSS